MSGQTADNPKAGEAAAAAAPLVVDLVGELLASDPRWEALLVLIATSPVALARAPRRAHFHPCAIERFRSDAAHLPYRQDVLESLRAAKRGGRRLVLVSDLPREVSEAVEGHLGLFDEIVTREGAPGRRGLRPRTTGWPGGMLAALRPHQWLKNLLLLLPLILAHKLNDPNRRLAALLAFWSLSLCASAVYILNDLLDLSSDRRHATKRFRPFASGRVSVPAGLLLAAGSLAAGLALSLALPVQFRLMLLGYLILTTAYSVWLKQKMLIDVMLLAALYTLRIIAGAAAVDVPLSIWLLAFSMFFFLSLAFVKRYSELVKTEHAGGDELSGRGYRVSDLRIIEAVGPASGYLSVLVFCNYLDSPAVRSLYVRPQVLWLVAPLLLHWVTRIWFVARRRSLDDDPVIYAVRDRVSQLTGVLAAAVVLLAWLPRPHWWPF